MIEVSRHYHKAIKALYENVSNPPWKLQVREGQGVHVLFFTAPDSPLQATITPIDAGIGGNWSSSYTVMHIAGNTVLSEDEKAWVERLHAAMYVLDKQDKWREMVDWAMTRPGISIKSRPENKGTKETSGHELLIRIIEQCNAACDFCGCIGITSDYATQEENIRERLLEGYENGSRRVAFTGGEPTLVKGLPAYVALAKEIGFDWVNIQTNGVRLEDRELTQSLADAGVDSLLLSLHSHIPELHDQIIKIEGGFHQAVEGIKNALRSGIHVGLNYVINRDNVDALPGYMEYVCGLWESVEDNAANEGITVTLSYVSPVGWTLEHLDLIPRITDAAPRIATALQTAENWGVEARIPGLCGIPICILPGYEEFFDEFYDESPALIQTRDYVAACDSCHHKGQCSGYWNKYYELYGEEEFGLNKSRNIPERHEGLAATQEELNDLQRRVAEFLMNSGISERDPHSQIPIPAMVEYFNNQNIPCPRKGRWSEKRCLQLLEDLKIIGSEASIESFPPWLTETLSAMKILGHLQWNIPGLTPPSPYHRVGKILDVEFTRQDVKLSLSSGPGFEVLVEDVRPLYAYDVSSNAQGLGELKERLANEPHVSMSEMRRTDSEDQTCRVTVGTRKGRRIIARWERESTAHHVPVNQLEDKDAYLLALGCDSPNRPVLFQITQERRLASLTPLQLSKEQKTKAFLSHDQPEDMA